jgi:UDP-N-acetylmuramate--alanine ligase
MTAFVLPPVPAQVHFVGIGGAGMSGLARMFAALGYRVTGSDSTPSEEIERLREDGVEIQVGHDQTAQAQRAGLVVITAAVDERNPEVAAALAAGIAVIKRARALGALAATRECVAVAGSHGKSTSSAMMATALTALGRNPSYSIGATLQATGSNAAIGSGPHMVVEADEYDWSFLELRPRWAIVTNIEFDHPDIFDSEAHYRGAFRDFASQIASPGGMVVRGDDPGGRWLSEAMAGTPGLVIRTFGLADTVDWRLSGTSGGWTVEGPDRSQHELRLEVPGRHNALNATAVIAMLDLLEIPLDAAIRAVGSFQGIGRRFERKGEAGGVLVIDDYAHHPTEIDATLQAARERFPESRLWAVFQPHTFSRTSALIDAFAEALSGVEHRVVLDVYGARETNDGRVSEDDMQRLAGPGGLRAGTIEEAATLLADLVKPGDVVLTLGAGSITGLGPQLLDHLARIRPQS